jgi:hypothetical protein
MRPIASGLGIICRVTVNATWNRRFLGVQILAFADHSYIIDIGCDKKPSLVSLGWYRWRPNYIEFPRWQRPPPSSP